METLAHYSEQFNGPYWLVGVRLIAILIGAWIFGPILAKRLDGDESDGRRIGKLIWITAIIAWVVLFSVGMLRHITFHSKAWDLAIFDQVIWNLANGNGWECSVRGVQDLRGDHFQPIILAFVPLYRALPHVGWLLGIQAAALVGAGLTIRAVYVKKIGHVPSYLLFLAFCFYPPLHWLALADFHPIALAPFFIAIGWLGSKRNNILVFLIGLIGLALCGEEGLIVGGWWGLWEVIARKPWRKVQSEGTSGRNFGWIGLILAVIFFAGFIWLSTVYIPAHRAEGEGYFYIHRYQYLGNTVGEIARNFFLRPGLWLKHAFDTRGFALLALYLVPLALYPIRRLSVLALLVPTILYTLLSVSDEQRSIFHQYTSIWIPFLTIASAEAIVVYMTTASWSMEVRTNPKRVQLRRASTLAVASFLGFLALSPIFGLSMHPEILTPEKWAPEAKGIVETIGPDVAVSAPSALCPHLSHRRVLLLQPDTDWPGVEEVVVLPEFPPEGERVRE